MPPDFPGNDPERRDELARLPHGRHGLPREFVAHNHRERLIASFTHLVSEQGYWAATINAITAGANVSSRTFYKHFETIEDCYIAAFEKAIEWIRPPVLEAFLGEDDWVASVRAALNTVLEEFSEFSDGARLLTAEPFVAGPKIALLHKRVIEEMAPYLARGRELRKAKVPLPETTETGLLGAANSLIGRQVFAAPENDLTKLAPDLLLFLLTPYLGATEASRIARAK